MFGTLTGDEVAILTDPFFQIAAPPGGHVKDYALAVGKVRYLGEPVVAVVAETRELARDAAELVMVDYEPLDVVVDARKALADGAPVLHEECGGNLSYSGVWEWGDVDAAFAEADHVVTIDELHFDRFNSTPLECDGALVEYNRGTGQWTMYTNNQFPGFAAIMMGPAMRVGLDKLRIVTQDIGGGFGNKITSHPQLVVVLPAGAQAQPRRSSGPSGGPSSTSRCRTATSAGSRTPRSRSRPTARCSASARRRSTTPARTSATSRSAA